MNTARGLLVGSAATLAMVASAGAADLPVKAKPVEYVKVCTLYGPAFYYIPGTDTCIRIGGHIRAEVSFYARGLGDQSWFVGDGLATSTRDRDAFFVRNRVYVNVDTRTRTSFGDLRTFSQTRFETNTGTGLGAGGGLTNIDAGFIQWSGFTIGHLANSYFDSPWNSAFKWGQNGSYGWPDSSSGRFVAAYTQQFGNGVTGMLSLEDGKLRKRGNYNGANALSLLGVSAPTVDTRGGNTWPEIVGTLRVEQPWGGLHLSAMVVNNHVAYNCGSASGATTVGLGGCSELAGNPPDKAGYGAIAVAMIKTPTGVNDALYIGGTYSKGATQDVFRNNGQGSSFGIYGGSNSPLIYGSITGTYVWDSVYNSATGIGQQLTTAYGGTIAFEHGWNAEWRTSVFGGAQVLDYSATANAILCGKFGVGSAAGGGGAAASAATGTLTTTGCNFDYRVAGAGSRTYWTPVKDLTIGVEVQWSNHHVGHAAGTVYNQPTIVGFKPNASYAVRDQNIFSGIFSVRRFF